MLLFFQFLSKLIKNQLIGARFFFFSFWVVSWILILMKSILIIERKKLVADFLKKALQRSGFQVITTQDGNRAAGMLSQQLFSLLILDLDLPCSNGWQVLDSLRGQDFRIPIIALSESSEITDIVKALDRGANDYISRPFQLDEIMARARAQIRAFERIKDSKENTLTAGKIRIDLQSRCVQVNNKILALSAKEFYLTTTLVSHAGQVMTREQLLNMVWGYDYEPDSTNIVNVYIGYLRKKLGQDIIETVRGIGYRIRA